MTRSTCPYAAQARQPRWRIGIAAAVTGLAAAGCSTRSGGGSAASTSAGPAASVAAGPVGRTTVTSAGTGAAVPPQSPAPVEANPPGDIPDSVAYVTYTSPTGRFSVEHPEGWASVVRGDTVTFTDKLNGITATSRTAAVAPTVASQRGELAAMAAVEPAFELRSVKPVSLPGGSGVLVVFRRNSAPDAVTGRVYRDEVDRYEVFLAGREVVLDLYGAVGSDNVDPYTRISHSLRLS